jgi:two-component system cell cycle sensor histidine kinase/response regulator CckA
MPQPDREPSLKNTSFLVPSFVRRRLGKLLSIAADQREQSRTNELAGTVRVLIADDEEAIRTLVEFALVGLGYEVHSAGTGLEAVELYRQKFKEGKRFDCVILDLALPGGMGGKEVLKSLREIDASVNAIVSSGYAMDASMSHYQDSGFRGAISKPYEAAELGRTVREVIESDRTRVASRGE